MSETTTHPLTDTVEKAVGNLRHYWLHNRDNRFWNGESRGVHRGWAEEDITRIFHTLGTEQHFKLQVTAGEKALQLFSFGSNAYDFLTIDRHFGDDYDLQPGQTMDIQHLHPDIGNDLYHGNVRALYLGGRVLHTPSIYVAETLTLGGGLNIVPIDTEETHDWRKK